MISETEQYHNTTLPRKEFAKDDKLQQTEEQELWTTEYLVDQIFLDLVKIKETISGDNGKTILIRKYYRQA